MRRLLAPHGYTVEAVGVGGCLHLKSAVTALAPDKLLANRAWIPMEPFDAFEIVDVDPAEPRGANALRVGATIVYPAEFPRTRERIEARGFTVRTVPAGELAKAEGGVTCCSLLLGGS
jgi:dimethylargininase